MRRGQDQGLWFIRRARIRVYGLFVGPGSGLWFIRRGQDQGVWFIRRARIRVYGSKGSHHTGY